MSIYLHLPAIVKLLLVFALVLTAIRKNLSLGNSFLLGAVVLGLVFGLDPGSMALSIVSSVLYPKTMMLSIIVSLILVLSSSMELSGHMKRLLNSFQGLIMDSRLNLVIFPALIGLLPMPGGAVFSAPMVRELGNDTGLKPDHLSYINYWFRHIWEYWWPLYPGVLLTVTMADIHLWTFVAFLSPLTIIAVSAGYLPVKDLIRPLKERNIVEKPSVRPFIRELSPILIVIVTGLGMGEVISFVRPAIIIAKEAGLVLSLCMAILWVWRINSMDLKQVRSILINRRLFSMIYMVFTILIFKGILEDSQAVNAISTELSYMHIPIWLISIILPFMVGSVVGITIAFVGSTFPILIALISSFNEMQFLLPYLMLSLVSGFVGVLLSPLHLCLLLSNKFFGTSLVDVYRHLWMPSTVILFAGIVYFWIAKTVLPYLNFFIGK